jgi:putative tryptophan/tyrosine transport system substrate-binding protein
MASHIERRKFLATLVGGAAAAWPLAARAQQGERVRRLGVLMSTGERDPETQLRLGAFREGLQKLGWAEGRNLRIDYRWGAGSIELATHAAELVALKPDVIFGAPSAAAVALHRETRTIPVVFAQVPDPVALGMVESLSRPGGNITGFALFEYAIALKWLELLKQIAPHVTRVGILYDPEQPTWPGYIKTIEATAPSFKVQILPHEVRDAEAIEGAIATLVAETNGGLIVLPGALLLRHRDLIISLAARHRLPSIFAFRYFVTGGGLASYGMNNLDLYRRAAGYVDRVLKGEMPANLPVQFADKFELVINVKTAKTLGLEVPVSLLARTDEVIE